MKRFAVPVICLCAGAGAAILIVRPWEQPGLTQRDSGSAAGAAAIERERLTPAAPVPPLRPGDCHSLLDQLKEGSALSARLRVLQYVSSLKLPEVKKLAQSMPGIDSGERAGILRESLMDRWAELDAEGLLRYARTIPRNGFQWAHQSAAMNAAIRALTRRDPQAAWRAAQINDRDGDIKRMVLTEMAQSDPAAALSLLQSQPDNNAPYAVRGIMAAWARTDPVAAAQAASGIKDKKLRQGALDSLASTWGSHDFAAAWEWAGALENKMESQRARSAALTGLAGTDPDKALTWLAGEPRSNQRMRALDTIMQALAGRDFQHGIATAMAFENKADQRRAMVSLADNMTAEDIPAMTAVATTLPPALQWQIYQHCVWQLAYQDTEKVHTFLNSLPVSPRRDEVVAAAASSMAWRDPEGAAVLLGQLRSLPAQDWVYRNLARSWSEQNPADALEWASALPSTEAARRAENHIYESLAGSDPQLAVQRLSSITDPERRLELTRRLTSGWAQHDDRAAAAWAATLPPDARRAATAALINHTSSNDPTAAAELYGAFASTLNEADAARAENKAVAATIATGLASEAPREALQWANGLNEGPGRDEAMASIAAAWAQQDARAASEWIQSLPQGTARDLAAGRLAQAIASDDPNAAYAWAISIGDAGTRRSTAAAVLGRWRNAAGRDAALNALDNSPVFTDSERAELRRGLE